MIALRDQLEMPQRLASRHPQRETLCATRTRRPVNPSGLFTRLAANRRDLHAALRMVYHAYRETDLIEPNPYELRATRYHLLSTTHLFLAEQQGELAGTITLVRDGDLRLPMEDVYASEVAYRRLCGATVAEVSCLADRTYGKGNSLSVVVQLMSHMAQFARRHDVDELLIAVHPHHVGFYERFIGFEQIGDEKSYSAVRDNPAVALKLDLNTLADRHPRSYERFFGSPFSDEELTARRIDVPTLAELRGIVQVTERAATHERQPLAA